MNHGLIWPGALGLIFYFFFSCWFALHLFLVSEIDSASPNFLTQVFCFNFTPFRKYGPFEIYWCWGLSSLKEARTAQ